jgi:hypothetical protein
MAVGGEGHKYSDVRDRPHCPLSLPVDCRFPTLEDMLLYFGPSGWILDPVAG